MRKLAIVLMACVAMGACKGDRGPTGPSGKDGVPGPQGPQGPAGPAGAVRVRVDTVPVIVEKIVYVERGGSTTSAPLTCNRLDPKNMAHPPQHWFYHPIPFDSLRLLCVSVS